MVNEGLSKINTLLGSFSTAQNGIGLQATVIQADGSVFNSTAGLANYKKSVPMSFDHHLHIGSITKMFTAAMVMQFIEQGRLSLEDTLDKWYKFPYAANINLRQLLNHTSGIPDYTQDMRFYARTILFPKVPWQPEQLVELIEGRPLQFDPGSEHFYSNTNYLLLGRILEKLVGNAYFVMLREMIFSPLELQDSYALDYPNDLLIANGYDETIVNLGRRNTSNYRRALENGSYSAGAMISTSTDVATFTHALFNGQIVSLKTLDEMQVCMDASDKYIYAQVGYGLGLRKLILSGQELYGHTGAIPGFSGISMHNPDRNTTIALLCNLSIIDYEALLDQLQTVVLET